MKIIDTQNFKRIKSENFNVIFRKTDGLTLTWGKTKDENPEFSPFGPLIADIEVTTICNGPSNQGPCSFCYKANTKNGTNMSFETFKKIFDKFPKTLTQIAFGADAKLESNPAIFEMMVYCRNNGVIPNITVADIDQTTADRLASLCGAVSVSRSKNKEWCYSSIKKLQKAGLKQTNMHILVSKESENWIWETLEDYKKGIFTVNAIVFLSLKQKGRGIHFNQLEFTKFKKIIDYCLDNNIPFGADSCTAQKILKCIINRPNFKELEQLIEPCESFGLFSSYVSVEGKYYPCSFVEEEKDWVGGIDMLKDDFDFMKDIWNSNKIKKYREMSISCGRNCLFFDI